MAALRASLAREQAMRRQTQAQLSTALDRVSLLERLVPAALEGSAASGAKLGTGPSSVEARAAGLDPESELRAAARRFADRVRAAEAPAVGKRLPGTAARA